MKRALSRLLLSAAAVLVGLGLAELGVRALGGRAEPVEQRTIRVDVPGRGLVPFRPGMGHLLVPSDRPELAELRGEFAPSFAFEWCYDVHAGGRRPSMDENGCIRVEINADRLRGPLVPRAKPAGVRRLVAAGDSFTFGSGVAFESTWLERLRAGAGPGWEAVNLGVPGYDARDVCLYLRFRALEYAPDLLLYGLFLNDVFVADRTGTEPPFDPLALSRRAYGEPTGIGRWSALWDLVARRLARAALDRDMQGAFRDAFREDSPDWQAFAEQVRQMSAAAADAGVPLVVVLFPELVSLDDYPFEEAHALVARLCTELGLPLVDTLDAFRGLRAEDLWVHVTDHHPNEDAHARIAELLLERLADRLR